MKNKIYKYDPQIYPRMLWVAVKPEYKTIKNNFCQDGIVLTEEQFNSFKNRAYGVTIDVRNIRSNDLGVLIIVFDGAKAESFAHESVHFADYIFEELGIKSQPFSESNEPYAYLVGWCTKCIEKSIKDKPCKKSKNQKN